MGANRKWAAAEDALLGKLPDPEVARRLGIGKLSVLKRRKKLGIPAAKLRRPIKPMFRGGMRVRLPKALIEKPIGDLTANEFLAAAREISRLRQSGRGG